MGGRGPRLDGWGGAGEGGLEQRTVVGWSERTVSGSSVCSGGRGASFGGMG